MYLWTSYLKVLRWSLVQELSINAEHMSFSSLYLQCLDEYLYLHTPELRVVHGDLPPKVQNGKGAK